MKEQIEKWKSLEIIGYPDYLVSNLGRVKSLKHGKEKLLKLAIRNDGYYGVTLSSNGNLRMYLVNRLVALAFLNKNLFETNLVVNHIDSNPLNNKLENLEIITNRQNTSIEKVKEKCEKFGCTLNVGVTKISDKFRIQFQLGDKRCYYGLYNDRDEANKLASKISNLIELNYTHKEIVTKLKTKLSLNPKKIIKIINSHEE